MQKISLFIIVILLNYSCGIKKNIIDSDSSTTPKRHFFIDNNFQLDYSDKKNWAFRSDLDDFNDILPKNYNIKADTMFNVSVFYIHPTTLYNSTSWNADTSYFQENQSINLCLENQLSVFAGITKLYAPHYREMHIYSYTDTVNGYKAFDFAYQDVLSAFQYFIEISEHDQFIIASHSQGTNHAKRLISEYIANDSDLLNRLILSYLIGMDIAKNELPIPLCDSPDDLNCFMTWRSFNDLYYPNNWKFGENFHSTNPINFSVDTRWSAKHDHLGVLFPNQRIGLKKSVSAMNKLGLVWVRLPNNIFINKYKSNSYHQADFNLFWTNIRKNLQSRLSLSKL